MECALYIRGALSIHQKKCRKSLGCALSTGKYGNIYVTHARTHAHVLIKLFSLLQFLYALQKTVSVSTSGAQFSEHTVRHHVTLAIRFWFFLSNSGLLLPAAAFPQHTRGNMSRAVAYNVRQLNIEIINLILYRVIHKSIRDFRTRLRNNQHRHGRKKHINRQNLSKFFFFFVLGAVAYLQVSPLRGQSWRNMAWTGNK
jgi:hypothetical protein